MNEFSVDPHRLEELLNYCMDFAKQMLNSYAEFHPFGAAIKAGGGFAAVGGCTGEEHPHSRDVYLLLQNSKVLAIPA
ncbi:MAG TPA: hypothetical protein VMY37_18680 [Thermoguttaceae bacterium]|nr:hypothetical protein [Thermoguttaceae bacterium]